MKLWHIAALVVAGTIVREIGHVELGPLFASATLHVFLPAIIFEAAWQLDVASVRNTWRAIVLLAVPGVAVTAGVIAACAVLGGAPLAAAALLGAILSATDPVAVTAIFRRLKVPAALAAIVESESLLNDAIAVLIYNELVAALAVGSFGFAALAALGVQSLLGSALGVAIGIACGMAGGALLRMRVSPFVQLAASVALAYLAYGATDRLHGSGIFAAIACAICMRARMRHEPSSGTATGMGRAWYGMATASNAALFFLIGASVDAARLWPSRELIVWAIVGVMLARALLAYGVLQCAPKMVRSWLTVVRLAGVRGAVSLALALSIPRSIAHAGLVVNATFAVVVTTILIGALTYGRRVARLEF